MREKMDMMLIQGQGGRTHEEMAQLVRRQRPPPKTFEVGELVKVSTRRSIPNVRRGLYAWVMNQMRPMILEEGGLRRSQRLTLVDATGRIPDHDGRIDKPFEISGSLVSKVSRKMRDRYKRYYDLARAVSTHRDNLPALFQGDAAQRARQFLDLARIATVKVDDEGEMSVEWNRTAGSSVLDMVPWQALSTLATMANPSGDFVLASKGLSDRLVDAALVFARMQGKRVADPDDLLDVRGFLGLLGG
jgi:hypothetical protein